MAGLGRRYAISEGQTAFFLDYSKFDNPPGVCLPSGYQFLRFFTLIA